MVWDAAITALGVLSDPTRLMFVVLGTFLGLIIGVIPGIGGLVGLALLLPFTFSMDPYTALAFLVGVQSVTTTSDTIPAVLFGVPGTVGSAATILDGHPMARRGEASRAYGAAFTASVCGGLFGAFVLALSIPILRPFILAVGTPELLSICLLGLTLVVSLSRGAMAKGMVAAAVGLLLSTVGDEPQTGQLRWSFDLAYLWDGLPLVPLALGLFAVPEIIDLGASRGSIAGDKVKDGRWQQLQGVRDVFKNWWLVIRCSSIGTLLGAIPGVGASVIDWVAYGYAARSVKDASKTFGKGDVRGVIASESSNNAKEGGALVPTVAFGVPGSASMALLLGAFLIHGIAPGPNMLDEHLDVTFTLIWTVAIANILGAGACFLFADQFARVATVRAGILVPLVFGIMLVGAFQGARDYGDLVVLVLSGVLGWIMKTRGWPRPPLVLAFVLGGLVENYLFISHLRYGLEWMLRPVPMVMIAIIAFMLVRPLVSYVRGGRRPDTKILGSEELSAQALNPTEFMMWAGTAALFVYVLVSSAGWEPAARLMPRALAVVGLVAIAGYFVWCWFSGGFAKKSKERVPWAGAIGQGLWLVGLVFAVGLIGMLPAMGLFVMAYMRFEGKSRWSNIMLIVTPYWLAAFFLFHELLHLPWPQSLLGDWLPALRANLGGLV
ncbi:MAG TPA: tripartite tricarboxylate transporter permease [Sulfuricaulis sp.]|nr:tripartite tricarboxylate transporter permease [Sulfuricaulis sp.]